MKKDPAQTLPDLFCLCAVHGDSLGGESPLWG